MHFLLEIVVVKCVVKKVGGIKSWPGNIHYNAVYVPSEVHMLHLMLKEELSNEGRKN